MADQQQEHQRETEGLLDSIRELRKEHQFETMLIDTFIPAEFQVRVNNRFTKIIMSSIDQLLWPCFRTHCFKLM